MQVVGQCIDDSVDLSQNGGVIRGSRAIQLSAAHQVCGAIARGVNQRYQRDVRMSQNRGQVRTLDDRATPEHRQANLILHPTGFPRSEGARTSSVEWVPS